MNWILLVCGEVQGYYGTRELAIESARVRVEQLKDEAVRKGEWYDDESVVVAEVSDEWGLVEYPSENGTLSNIERTKERKP